MVNGLGIETIDWNSRIAKEPTRYSLVRNEENDIVEVHDHRTGEVWFRISNNRWMRM